MTKINHPQVVKLPRRTVLAAGGVVAVGGVLVACGGNDSGESSATDPTQEEASVAEEVGQAEVQADQGQALVTVDQVPVEGGVVVSEPPVVVVQPAQGDIRAFSAVCPHQGCLVSSVEANEIVCPCHGSLFSAQDGAVLAGPATSGLPPVTIAVQGDSVFLG
jgi:Rieske Fe-S protein